VTTGSVSRTSTPCLARLGPSPNRSLPAHRRKRPIAWARPARALSARRRLPARGRAAEEDGRGVVKEPSRMDYGGIDAVFDDTFGNLINLHQE
jgi:hypothetical protein